MKVLPAKRRLCGDRGSAKISGEFGHVPGGSASGVANYGVDADMEYPGLPPHAPALTGLLEEAAAPASRFEWTQRNESAELTDRARGVTLGLACGNLLGLPVESEWHYDIARWYPEGVRHIAPHERDSDLDDDLAQAVELAEALLSGDDYVPEFARRLVDWYRYNGRGIGHTTRRVLHRLHEGYGHDVFAPARQVYEQHPIAPNGGVMRCAPVAIIHRRRPERLVSASALTCAVTHYSATCQWSCIIVNAIIASFLNGQVPDLPAIYAAAIADGCPDLRDIAHRDGIPTDALDAVADDENPPPDVSWLLDGHGLIGHTLLAMQFGLWAATTPLSLEDALVASVGAGGDTDTNGAVAGAVLGARYGASAAPERWQDVMPQRQRISGLADSLLSLS